MRPTTIAIEQAPAKIAIHFKNLLLPLTAIAEAAFVGFAFSSRTIRIKVGPAKATSSPTSAPLCNGQKTASTEFPSCQSTVDETKTFLGPLLPSFRHSQAKRLVVWFGRAEALSR